MDFFGFFLTVLVLTLLLKESNKTPWKLCTHVADFEFADPQYVADFSYNPVLTASLSEDNPKLPSETEYAASDDDNFRVTEDQNKLDSSVILPTKIQYLYQDDEDFSVTTLQAEPDATPTVQVDVDTTVVNNTPVTEADKLPFSVSTTLLKLATVMITVMCAALFFTTLLIMWNMGFIVFSVKYKKTNEINCNDAELGNVKHHKHTYMYLHT